MAIIRDTDLLVLWSLAFGLLPRSSCCFVSFSGLLCRREEITIHELTLSNTKHHFAPPNVALRTSHFLLSLHKGTKDFVGKQRTGTR